MPIDPLLRSYRGPLAALCGLGVILLGALRGGAQPIPLPAVYESTVTAARQGNETPDERAGSTVFQSDIERRQPRSAPDALRFEPGIFVQQTAHGQGSAFIRGLTGQQTLLLFDGIRLNNATYRQGPNQYLFTVDARTLDSIEVLRGGGSTRFGSDALGGVIYLIPRQPAPTEAWLYLRPRVSGRASTVDQERGGRFEIEAGWVAGRGLSLRFLGGLGAREAGLLEAAGPIHSLENGRPTTDPINLRRDVPRFAGDGRRQLGTGYKEITGDGRLVLALSPAQTLTAAAYVYRGRDIPRTDQCPPAEAPYDECLKIEEQSRTLVYGAWDGRFGRAADELRLTLSWQRQSERRRLDRPSSRFAYVGADELDSFGLTARNQTSLLRPHRAAALRLRYGGDLYLDRVHSQATAYDDLLKLETREVRGQYVPGSSYLTGGLYASVDAFLGRRVTLRGGARLAVALASSPEVAVVDREGGRRVDTPAVGRSWAAPAGHLGVEVRVLPQLSLLVNGDHSFRAPNLDDLTARQATGAGFQCESPGVGPERATTVEGGARIKVGPLTAEGWLFETMIQDLLLKQVVPSCPGLVGYRTNVRLANAPGLAEIRGAEIYAKLRLPWGFGARATFAYAWGESNNLAPRPADPKVPYEERVPVSRIPPLNGTAELWWSHGSGFGAGAMVRWAGPQSRLSVADRGDSRIPFGGTPGFGVVDLRASYRLGSAASVNLLVENLLDSPYRYHGSGVNGGGRGFLLALEAAPF